MVRQMYDIFTTSASQFLRHICAIFLSHILKSLSIHPYITFSLLLPCHPHQFLE